MAHTELKTKAITMRLSGMSYSQIKEVVPVSKSTLSVWLENYPLSQERIRELRDLSPKRIESVLPSFHLKLKGGVPPIALAVILPLLFVIIDARTPTIEGSIEISIGGSSQSPNTIVMIYLPEAKLLRTLSIELLKRIRNPG